MTATWRNPLEAERTVEWEPCDYDIKFFRRHCLSKPIEQWIRGNKAEVMRLLVEGGLGVKNYTIASFEVSGSTKSCRDCTLVSTLVSVVVRVGLTTPDEITIMDVEHAVEELYTSVLDEVSTIKEKFKHYEFVNSNLTGRTKWAEITLGRISPVEGWLVPHYERCKLKKTNDGITNISLEVVLRYIFEPTH